MTKNWLELTRSKMVEDENFQETLSLFIQLIVMH